jgi:hypothetical protein
LMTRLRCRVPPSSTPSGELLFRLNSSALIHVLGACLLPRDASVVAFRIRSRALLAVEGSDAPKFLHNLSTNDISLLQSKRSLYAHFLNSSGMFSGLSARIFFFASCRLIFFFPDCPFYSSCRADSV